MAFSIKAQNCAPGSEVTAPAGGSVLTASTLRVYNSQEAGPNSAANRTTVDTYDDAWRAGVTTAAGFPIGFVTFADNTTPQQTIAVPQVGAFLGINYDYRDFPLDFRTIARPCIGSQIATVGERVVFLSKNDTMQTVQDAPRPALLYNASNQFLVYDEIEAGNQPNRINTANAVVFTFPSPTRAFGAWFGDVETRTLLGGNPAIVRFLDSTGNRIGSDVLIEPRSAALQLLCGDSAVGCGNQTTRWIGFLDTNASARVKQMVVINGYQGGTDSSWGDQRVSFVGPTVPNAPFLVPTAAGVTVSGYVRSGKSGVRNAVVTMLGYDGTGMRTVKTNSFGYFNFTEVPVGSTYLVSVSAKGFSFMPDTQVLTLVDAVGDIDFEAQE